MKLPAKMYVIVGKNCNCDTKIRPHELVYFDVDWACTDAKEINKDHPGHRIVKVRVMRIK